QIEHELSTEARSKVPGLGVDEPALILAKMAGELPPRARDKEIAQIPGDKEQLIAPLAGQHRTRATAPRSKKHRLHGTRPIVDARPLRVPCCCAKRFGIDWRHRHPINPYAQRGFERADESLFLRPAILV